MKKSNVRVVCRDASGMNPDVLTTCAVEDLDLGHLASAVNLPPGSINIRGAALIDDPGAPGTLDHVVAEGEWWQTDLDCKLQDYGLYVGGTIDVATRFLYNISVLTFKSSLAVWRQVQEPPLRQHGFPAKYTMDKGSENWILAFAVMQADENDGRQGAAKMRFVQSKRNVRSECFVPLDSPLLCLSFCLIYFLRVSFRIPSWQLSASGAS